jgi:outer membrane immunogenic protein
MRFAEANWRTKSLGAFPIDSTNYANYNGTGFRAAVLVGYDWQIAARWVVGVESEFGFADKATTLPGFLPGISGSFFGGPILPGDTASVKTTWDGALTARLGYLLRPSMLLYATGGIAWQRVEANSTCGAFTCGIPETSTDAETMFGWTLGGGLETKLWRNWRARTEYRYADFGTMRANFTYFGIPDPAVVDIKVRTHTAQFALIYDWN